ncbi:MAG: Fic family protein [Betaproteobacteria bacterium]|nr:Fic family protein [Betaproteobacteria bacterium]
MSPDNEVSSSPIEVEALVTRARLYELSRQPLPDRFDAQHLKYVHGYIFQDLPLYGIEDPLPGKFRYEITRDDDDWYKSRKLKSIDTRSVVCYSHMNKATLDDLRDTLRNAAPAILRQLKTTAEFVEKLSRIYAKLDYIHPFYEGNSRALCEFTRQIALASGYELAWDKFNLSDTRRDLLNIARDRAVGELAVPKIRNHDISKRVVFYMDKFEQTPSLRQLFKSAVRPRRAVAFEKLPKKTALIAHPELQEAFKALHASEQFLYENSPDTEDEQQSAMEKTKQHILARLNAGETKNFQRNKKS